MKKKFNFENKNLDLHIEKISVEKATKIDFNSDSFIQKAQTIFNELSIKVIDDENIIFDSEKNNYNDLNFNLCLKIIQNIESELCLNEKEALQYQNLCIDFLNDKHDKMPYELILAKDILNKNLTFNFSDYSKMEMKTYEKIQLGLIILRETSDNKINQE